MRKLKIRMSCTENIANVFGTVNVKTRGTRLAVCHVGGVQSDKVTPAYSLAHPPV